MLIPTGMDDPSDNPSKFHGTTRDLILSRNRPPEHHYNATGKLPKLSFPTFDGTGLKLWITCAEDYFIMYSVHPSVWIQCSRMQFVGPAKHWIQSVTDEIKTMQWSEFCQALHARFDRDQHEILLRKMNRIHQTSSVQDYVDRFAELVDQLKAYDSTAKALPHITRFIDGLHSEIHVVLLVQRPTSLDTAYTLALLQEEVVESSRRRDSRPWNPKGGYSRGDRSGVAEPDKHSSAMKPLDKKLADLKAYRRARGLCDHCGEKWSRDHKCAAKVGLNVLDELYALFSNEALEDGSTPEDEEAGTDAHCCCLAWLSSAGSRGQTLQFHGILQQRPVMIMLDSGSSCSFISSQLVSQLSIVPSKCAPFSVRVANGALMQCSTVVSGAVWRIH